MAANYHNLLTSSFAQDWSNVNLITVNDDWSGVFSIDGFLGDDASTSTAPIDPQTVVTLGTGTLDVIASQTNPSLSNGGVAEFELPNPVVALQGSGTADSPFLLLYLDTTGVSNINVSYNLRDIDGSADNAIQPVALQYRLGTSGNFINIPTAFISDASTGPSLGTLVTPVNVILPTEAENQSQVQLRIITGNATGSDEWIGIDDILISGTPIDGGGATAIVNIEALDSQASEAGSDAGTFRIARTGDTSASLTVNYTVATGASQATNGIDYTLTLTGTTEIPIGASFVDITVTPVDDSEVEGSESITLNLVDGADYDLGVSSATTVILADNDVESPTITQIHLIQGGGAAATPGTFAIEGIVVGDFQDSGQLGGFYLQEEDFDTDGSALTSEGIFVNSLIAVNAGDKVRITGTVVENSSSPSFNQAVITPGSVLDVSVLAIAQQGLVTSTVVDLPVTTLGNLERYEGMLVTFPETLTVTENFNLGRFGEVTLSSEGRLFNPTNLIDPNDALASGTTSTGDSNVAAVTAQQDLNNRRQILLDDGSSLSNLSNVPYIDTTDANLLNDALRLGSTVTDLTGVLGFGFSNYRLQPTETANFNYAARPDVPSVGNANVKVASFNVLNYFNGDGLGAGFPTSRGADSLAEFNRQRAKTFEALKGLDADIVGLIEVENDGDGANSAIADLVNGLNASIGVPDTYAYISDPTGANGNPGSDEIKVTFIYKPSAVTPIGLSRGFNDPVFESLGRPPVAQTFQVNANGAIFTPIINHFKSKSATGATGLDLDQGDGQGAFNETRRQQAIALLNFVNEIKTVSADEDVLIIGDLNAYGEEDPIDTLRAGGLIDELADASNPYSFVFSGQAGRLDYAFTTSGLSNQVTGVAEWHINADEPNALDYNNNIQDAGESSSELRNDTSLYQIDSFRSSDHDPVLIGLNLVSSNLPPTAVSDSYTTTEDAVLTIAAPGLLANDSDVDGDSLSVVEFTQTSNGIITVNPDGSFTYIPNVDFSGNDSFTYTIADSLGEISTTTVDITVTPFVNLIKGTSASERLIGTNRADIIKGLGGNDKLIGGDGNDVLVGGEGADKLTGGDGYDRFVYSFLSESGDRIKDFTATGNESDVLDLRSLFDNLGYSGSDPLTDGYLNLVGQRSSTRVEIDADGLGSAASFTSLVTLSGVIAIDLLIGINILI